MVIVSEQGKKSKLSIPILPCLRRGPRQGFFSFKYRNPTLPVGVVFGCMQWKRKCDSLNKPGGYFSQVRRNPERSIHCVCNLDRKKVERQRANGKEAPPGVFFFFSGGGNVISLRSPSHPQGLLLISLPRTGSHGHVEL